MMQSFSQFLSSELNTIRAPDSFNPSLETTYYQLLRNVESFWVSFGESGRISNIPLDIVLAAANGDHLPILAEVDWQPTVDHVPDWAMDLDHDSTIHINVADCLVEGEEPIDEIMEAVMGMDEGGFLVVEVPFDPVGLREVLAAKGLACFRQWRAPDHLRIIFELRRRHRC